MVAYRGFMGYAKRRLYKLGAGAFAMGALGAGKGSGGKTKRRGPGSYTGTKRKGTVGKGVTTQKDSANIYRKRRMPRRKRARWRNFVSKVKAATKEQGTISMVYNGSYGEVRANQVAGIFQQGLIVCHLYGRNASGKDNREVGGIDMLQVCTDLRNATADPLKGSGKIQFKSAVLDITVTNPTDNTNYNGALEIDVYHIHYPKAKEYVVNGLVKALEAGSSQTSQLLAAPKVDISQRGATPFGIGQIISISGMEILDKKKYFLPQGESFTYQIRDPKNRTIDNERLVDKATFYMPGWTQSVLLIAKPTDIIETADTFSFSVGATRSYNVTYEGLNEDKSRYLGGFI